MYLLRLYYYIMAKKEEKEPIIFRRYCPILDKVIQVEWWLHEWELEVEKQIEELDKKEGNI